jgi:hypothetical protein
MPAHCSLNLAAFSIRLCQSLRRQRSRAKASCASTVLIASSSSPYLASCDNPQHIVWQRPLQRLGLLPWHPDVAFFVCQQDHRHGLRMDRLDDGVWRRGKKAVDVVRTRDPLRFGAAIALELGPDAREAVRGRSSWIANQTTSFFFVSGFGSGAYSAKLLNGTRQRLSGFSQPRQCGEEVLRILVTGGPPVRGGGGMTQRIVTNSRSALALRTTGVG